VWIELDNLIFGCRCIEHRSALLANPEILLGHDQLSRKFFFAP
jgi:hypothetical protein